MKIITFHHLHKDHRHMSTVTMDGNHYHAHLKTLPGKNVVFRSKEIYTLNIQLIAILQTKLTKKTGHALERADSMHGQARKRKVSTLGF